MAEYTLLRVLDVFPSAMIDSQWYICLNIRLLFFFLIDLLSLKMDLKIPSLENGRIKHFLFKKNFHIIDKINVLPLWIGHVSHF